MNIAMKLESIAAGNYMEKIPLIRALDNEELIAFHKKLEIDFEYWIRVCMSHVHKDVRNNMPIHHKKLAKVMNHRDPEAGLYNGYKYSALVLFRGAGKSFLKRCKIMHEVCHQLEVFILLIHNTINQSQKDLLAIKNEIEVNLVIKEIYGELTPKGKSAKWNMSELAFTNGVYICIAGTEVSVRGFNWLGNRVTKVYLDDFEGENNTSSAEIRDRLLNWIVGNVLPIGDADFKILFIGTIVHPEAFLAKTDPDALNSDGSKKNPDSIFCGRKGIYVEYKVSEEVYYGDESKQLTPTFESAYPVEEIHNLYKLNKSINKLDFFYQEYYNIPKQTSNPVFKMDMINEIDAEFKSYQRINWIEMNGVKTPVNVYLGIDLNVKPTMSSDDFCIVAIGITPNENYIILDIFAERIRIEDHPDVVIEWIKRFNPIQTNIECVQYQLSLAVQVQKIIRDNYLNYLVMPFDKKISKSQSYNETDGLAHYINRGKFGYLKYCNNIDKLKTQGNAYSAGVKREHDDILDGCYIGMKDSYPAYSVDVDKLIQKAKDKLIASKNKAKNKKTWMTI